LALYDKYNIRRAATLLGRKMRIQELLEGKQFNDLEFITKEGDNNELNFDLPEDLSYFMHHHDQVYREHVYPVIAKCLHHIKNKQDFKPSVFEQPVKNAYSLYLREYPIRHLPDDLDSDTLKKVCELLHSDFKKHVADGLYKD
jgi:hypothetical protein